MPRTGGGEQRGDDRAIRASSSTAEQPGRSEGVPGLDQLAAAITPENRHDETDWGKAHGAEAW